MSEPIKVTPFFQGVYLYDLNSPELPPLAYRSACGGEEQKDVLSLVDLSAREWSEVAAHLYRGAVFLGSGGVILLPAFGSLGRFFIAVKTSLSLSAFAYVYQSAGQGEAYADSMTKHALPKLSACDREEAESAVRTVTVLRELIEDCQCVHGAYEAEECIARAAEIMGVTLMPREKAEAEPMQGQGIVPDASHAWQVLFVCVMTLLSVMRNGAHGRSGWLYAAACDKGYSLQAFLRCEQDANAMELARLRALLEDGGVAVGARTYAAPLKPPKQYAYMSRKITDPHKPLCARCGCLDKRCADCTAMQWVVLPYVGDVALLGIKAEPIFKE